MEPTETEIFLLTQHESISRESAIELLKDFNSKNNNSSKNENNL
jgi:hypothetical protein